MEHKDLYLRVLIAIGIWFAVVTVFGVWEYNILKAEIVLNQKLPSHERVVDQIPFAGGRVTYIVEMFVWTAIILVLGFVWSELLFPMRTRFEKFVFSLVFGVFVMPLSIFIPFTAITIATVFSTLTASAPPTFIGPTLNQIVALFVNGQEQIYEFANVFAFFALGAILLFFKNASQQTTNH